MTKRRPLLESEDWMALWLGLLIFALSMGQLIGLDLLGWSMKTNVWMSLGKAVQPVSAGFAGLGGGWSLVLTFLFLLGLMTLAAK
ncbi:MAG TPA: putative sulfate exporter family transporter, partial [Vicinamibacteria bacterium]|nr:putative sulfate exporter family transporter [Vicinamibacteria bacterium]